MADNKSLVDQIVGLSLLDAADIVKQLEEKLGISAAAPVAVAAAPAAGGGQRRRQPKRKPRSTSS